MIRKTAVAVGIGAVVVLGIGGTALAAQSGPAQTPAVPTPSATPTPTPAPGRSGNGHQRVNLNFPGELAQWTTFDTRTNTATVHDGIRGQVSAVSSTSITVNAAGGTSQTYVVDANTRVRAAMGKSGAIDQIKVGDQVVVVGTGQSSFTATAVAAHGMAQQKGHRHR